MYSVRPNFNSLMMLDEIQDWAEKYNEDNMPLSDDESEYNFRRKS